MWIPVRVDRPDNYQPVLAYVQPSRNDSPRIVMAIYREGAGATWPNNFFHLEDFAPVSLLDVTHWMPLPSPPVRHA